MIHLKYLYHYTSVDVLAIILSTKSFRFSPLSYLDDLQEEKTADISDIGKTVFISSWTSDEKESIPMWNMYSRMDAGVRIKASTNLFEDYVIDKPLQKSTCLYFSEDIIIHPTELTEVRYSDDAKMLFPTIIGDGGKSLNQELLGIYKNTLWEFQKEWRYIVRAWPSRNFTQYKDPKQEYKKFSSIIDTFLYLKIKPDLFKNMEITLSPKISEGNRIIVNTLIKNFCPSITVKDSELFHHIR